MLHLPHSLGSRSSGEKPAPAACTDEQPQIPISTHSCGESQDQDKLWAHLTPPPEQRDKPRSEPSNNASQQMAPSASPGPAHGYCLHLPGNCSPLRGGRSEEKRPDPLSCRSTLHCPDVLSIPAVPVLCPQPVAMGAAGAQQHPLAPWGHPAQHCKGHGYSMRRMISVFQKGENSIFGGEKSNAR